MVRTRILLFLVGLILVPTATYLVVLFARGYRPNFINKTINPTGILATKSTPDAAQIYIDGSFKGATNTTFNLNPGAYGVEIKKDTYSSWKKDIQIRAEEVSRAYVTLFPAIPSLKAVTTTGAAIPALSPDGAKIAYLSGQNVYTLDLTDSPLGLLNRDSQLVYQLVPSKTEHHIFWSPDSRQILVTATPSAILIDLANRNTIQEIGLAVAGLQKQWQTVTDQRELQKRLLLPESLQNILATSAAQLTWSAKENKLLYTATASATIADNLIRPLPGSSTQTQDRTLARGKTYIYDLEEDKNFAIPCPIANVKWFATSEHVICTEKNKITVLEYDGLNPVVVYAGPLEAKFVFSYPSAKQILMLANLDAITTTAPNLYALDLK